MHPVLIEFGPVVIHTYGVIIAIAFLAALGFIYREAKARSLDTAFVQDIGILSLIGSVVGSRILYVLINLDYFVRHPFDVAKFWQGGLVFIGGAILASGLVISYLWKHHQPIRVWADAVAPGLALGQGIGWIGCLAAGSSYGEATRVPWAITFTDQESLAPLFVPLHPTQIYHSLEGFLSFGIVLALERRLSAYPGKAMGVYLVLSSVSRFVIELFRGDHRGHIGPVSTTQALAMVTFLIGAWLLAHHTRQAA